METVLAKVKFGSRAVELPGNRIVRIAMGVGLVILGIFGAVLPVLGVWMIPLGLIVLSVDIPVVRRLNRRASVAFSRWWHGRKSRRERQSESV
jgi:hypothetical protein